jgi:hypothetical protein
VEVHCGPPEEYVTGHAAISLFPVNGEGDVWVVDQAHIGLAPELHSTIPPSPKG